MSIIMYGATYCGDTIRVRAHLKSLQVQFEDVNIDNDAEAEKFVLYINHARRTPPLVFDLGANKKLVLSEPSNPEVAAAVALVK
jgi:glutaredoxin-related protein